jgi:hypothetical protein
MVPYSAFVLARSFIRPAQAALILVSLTQLPCSVTDTPFTQATTQTC